MKKLKLLTYVIMAISAVVTIYFMLDTSAEGGRVGPFLIWAYILFGLSIVLILVLPLFNIISNPKALKKMAINVGFIVVVLGLSYLLASSAQTSVTEAMPVPPSASTMKLTDAGLKAAYVLFAGSLLAILFGAVLGVIRNR